MPRNPSLASMSYSFGPGPVTPAVRVLLWPNFITYFVVLLYSPLISAVWKFWVWQLGTYMVLHALTPTHVLVNMLALWMFGVELERIWRTRFFVKYYLITGTGAGAISVLVSLLPFAATHATYPGPPI